MSFDTPIIRDGQILTGPLRRPAQMLADQEYAGHTSVNDDDTAAALGLATASVGRDDATELDERRQRGLGDPGQLYIVDQLEIAMRVAVPEPVTMSFEVHNGNLYPFTLTQKLERITECSSWYLPDGDSPWGRPIVPTEMISVIAHRSKVHLPVRGPAIGLFVDLEMRYVEGPVLVGQPYRVEHTVVGVGQTRRVESYWTESTLTDAETGAHAATVLLHQGVFKASYADYPA